MKILSAEQTRQADQHTIKNEPISSIDLMERASKAFTEKFTEYFESRAKVRVFAGIGNNGGDGLCIARMLSQQGIDVKAYAIRFSDSSSDDFQTNEKRLMEETNVELIDIYDNSELPEILEDEILIDGLFGSGLNRPIEGLPGKVIEHLNDNIATKVAIDVPSGIFADKPSEGIAFEADLTITFQQPKLAFMFPENYDAVGEWVAIDIGLDQEFIQSLDCSHQLISIEEIRQTWRYRGKYDYKNTFGHTLIVAGSLGKIGAAILSAKACLYSGAGLVTAYLPKCGYVPMQTALPEIMVEMDEAENKISKVKNADAYDTIAIGPGIGTSKKTSQAFHDLLHDFDRPMVIDADALNILGQHPTWMEFIPKYSILTPHPGEFKRLAGDTNNDFEELEVAQKLAQKHEIIIVIKRAHAAICMPNGKVWFNDSGNPGMGTAGSGDVLTGIIAGFLSQGYQPEDAAKTGVFVHGMAGDEAASTHSEQSITAGKIIDSLGKVFLRFES